MQTMQTQLINFVIPEKLLSEVDLLAREDSRSRSELIREAVRLYIKEQKTRKDDFTLIHKAAKRVNFTEEKAISIIEKTRKKVSLNQ